MRSKLPLAIAAASVASVLALSMAAAPAPKPLVNRGVSPTLQSIGPLAIGPAGILYAADPMGATIFALDLSKQRAGVPGTKDIAAIDQAIASTLGTAASEITIVDLKVEPKSKNSYLSVLRGQGPNATPVIVRVDGAGKIDVISLDGVAFTSVALPNAPDANPTSGRTQRTQSITNLAFVMAKCSSPVFRTKSSRRSCGVLRIHSRRRIAVRAWKYSTATTDVSRRGRRCMRSCRTR